MTDVVSAGTINLMVQESSGDEIPKVYIFCAVCNEKIGETYGFSRSAAIMDTHWTERHSVQVNPQLKTEHFG